MLVGIICAAVAVVLLILLLSGQVSGIYFFFFLFAAGKAIESFLEIGANKKILFGSRLSPLTDLGFTIENQDDYWGYKGYYRGYFMRISYEPSSRGKSSYGSEEIIVTLYFNTSLYSSEKIEELRRKYIYNRWWRRAVILIGPVFQISNDHITQKQAFNFVWSFKGTKKIIDSLVDLAEREGLLPKMESEINQAPFVTS
jgi:hypothetical protein